MKRIWQIVLCCTLWLVGNSAFGKTDFVGLLISQLPKEQVTDSVKPDYECITVSPDMIQRMFKIAKTTDENAKEIYANVLKHIKSMRMFSADDEKGKYRTLATDLLNKKQWGYTPYKPEGKKNIPCIYINRTKDVVSEIVFVESKEGFSIIDITGELSNEFVQELMKL